MFEQDTGGHDARHRVVIVGGGVAGLDLAGALARDTGLAVTLIDLATAHVWKPMLHSIAAGTRASAGVEVPYVAQARRHGFTYAAGAVLDIDRAARTVHVDRFVLHGRDLLPERRIAYDTLVLAVGSVAAPFGVEGVEAHARHIDTLVEAQGFQADLLPRLKSHQHQLEIFSSVQHPAEIFVLDRPFLDIVAIAAHGRIPRFGVGREP